MAFPFTFSSASTPTPLPVRIRGVVGRHGAKKGSQPQSYLMKARYRSADLLSYLALKDKGALELFARTRWGDGWKTEQICPHCGTRAAHYKTKRNFLWRCRAKLCQNDFTVFTETCLHGAKIKPIKILGILAQFVEAKDSVSAREIGGLWDMRQQSAHVLLLKIREALQENMLAEPRLTGIVQCDAAYFIKYKRPRNLGTKASAETRAKSRAAGIPEVEDKSYARHPDMHALVVFVESAPQGYRRYRLMKVKTEFQVDMARLAAHFCDPPAQLITDQLAAYIGVGGSFIHDVVDHGAEFTTKTGINTNHAESFFSRLRHSQAGAWHRMSVQHLQLYGWEVAWRQAVAGRTNGDQMTDLLRRIFTSKRSVRFSDYWRKKEDQSNNPANDQDDYMVTEYPKDKVPKKTGRPENALRIPILGADPPPAPTPEGTGISGSD